MAFAVFIKAIFLLGFGSLRYHPFFFFGCWRPIDSLKEELVFIAPPIIHVLITSISFIARLIILMMLPFCNTLRYKIRNLLEEIQFQGFLLVFRANFKLELFIWRWLLWWGIVSLYDPRISRIILIIVNLLKMRKYSGINRPISVLLFITKYLHLVFNNLALWIKILLLHIFFVFFIIDTLALWLFFSLATFWL